MVGRGRFSDAIESSLRTLTEDFGEEFILGVGRADSDRTKELLTAGIETIIRPPVNGDGQRPMVIDDEVTDA